MDYKFFNSIEQSTKYFQYLSYQMNSGSQNFTILSKLFSDAAQIYETFGLQLTELFSNYNDQLVKQLPSQSGLRKQYQLALDAILNQAKHLKNISQNFQTELIQPFKILINNYKGANEKSIQPLHQQLSELDGLKKQIDGIEEHYYNTSRKIEKEEENISKALEKVTSNSSKKQTTAVQKLMDNIIKLKMENQEEFNSYKILIQTFNTKYEAYVENFQTQCKAYDFNNESRLSVSYYSLERLVEMIQSDYSKIKMEQQGEDHQTQTNSLNIIERASGLKYEQLKGYRRQIVSYDQYKRTLEQDTLATKEEMDGDFILITESIPFQQRELINSFINRIVSNKDYHKQYQYEKCMIPHDQQPEIIKNSLIVLKDFDCAKYFIDSLITEIKTSETFYLNEFKFVELVTVIATMLQHLEQQKIVLPSDLFYSLLLMCQKFGRKKKLESEEIVLNFLGHLQIWQNVDCWFNVFQLIKSENIQKLQRNEVERKKMTIKSTFFKGIKIVGKTIQILQDKITDSGHKQPQDEEQIQDQQKQKELEYNAIMLALDQINQCLIDLSITNNFTSSVIITLAKQNNIEISILRELIEDQYEKNLTLTKELILSYQKKQQNKARKKDKTIKKFKSFKTYCISLALPYISLEDNPTQLLEVNKDFYLNLKKPVLSMYLYPKLANVNQVQVWTTLLINQLSDNTKFLKYEEIKQKIEDDPNNEILESVEEVIVLDAKRSLAIHNLDQQLLVDLLKAYVYSNPEISYCQGMNYIMGYLLIYTKSPQDSLNCFNSIIHNYYKDLFQEDLKNLKQIFFQFEQCLHIFLPELAIYLKEQNIQCMAYAAPWFITIFSCAFQYTMESEFLRSIWDIFFMQGIKGLFKVCICILRFYEKYLINSSFDESLTHLSKIIQEELFVQEPEEHIKKFITNIKQDIQTIPITNYLLTNLANQYQEIVKLVDEQLEQYEKEKKHQRYLEKQKK